ncbi:MAG: tetratricopeptide repeat protein, partial [Nannocystaceae bacterium]
SRLDEVHALVDVMVEADDRTIEKAVVAAETLPSIGRCSNIAAMQAKTLNLPDPESAELRTRLRPQFDRAHALDRLGHDAEAREIYEEVEPEVFASKDRSLHAHYRRLLAGVLHTLGEDEQAENIYFAALADAAASGDAEELARIALGFLDLRSTYQSDIQALDRWHQVAQGALVRHGTDDDLEMYLIRRYGSALRRLGDNHRALAAHRKALEMHTELVGPLHYNTLAVRYNLGSVYWQLGRYDEAEAEFDFVVPRWPERIGKTHPLAITVLNGRGVIAMARGRFSDAIADFEEALERKIELHGEDHRRADDARENLAVGYSSSRRFKEALELLKRVLAGREKTLGVDNRYVGWTHGNLSRAYRYLGKYEEALTHALRAREILTKSHKGDHPEIVKTYLFTGLLSEAQGRHDEAKQDFQAAQKMLVDTNHETHPDMVEIYYHLAVIALEAGELEVAEKNLAELRRVDDGREERPDCLGDYLGLEAKLAWLKGKRKAANKARKQANTLYKGLGARWEPDRRKLDQWFAKTKLGGPGPKPSEDAAG